MRRTSCLFLALAAWLAAPDAPLPAAEPLSPYGVCAHLPRGDEYPTAREELKLMRAARIGWARADFDWSYVEPRRGEWRFDRIDDVVDWAEQEGVNILPILDYDVPWARPAYKHLDLWLEYVRRVVERYKDRIRHWEVWNEPNLEQFWKDKPDAANYVALLKPTYELIKKIDPELTVLFGGTAEIPWAFIEGVYAAGGKDSFDVMNVHPYRYPRAPEEGRPLFDDLVRLRELMAKYGDGEKPIWITEIGWPTHQGQRGVSPERQAEMLARAYLLSFQAGVEVVFWYEFQAPEHKPDYNEDHFGIVHRDLRPKPAYRAMAALTRARPAGSKQLPGEWRTGEVYHPAWRRPDGATAWAVWRPAGEADVTFAVEGTVGAAFDHLGGKLDVRPVGGRFALRVGTGPVYLIGPARLRPEPRE
jgi:hypothetical protein